MSYFDIISKVWRKPFWVAYYLVTRLSFWRRWWLKLQARMFSGTVIFGRDVLITHSTVFQGFGTLILEDGVRLGFILGGKMNSSILFQPRLKGAFIRIGCGTQVMNGCEFIACKGITLGRNCLVGAGSVFLDSDFHGIRPEERNQPGVSEPIIIGDNVWLGRGVTVLKGVCIGNDAVIGANCVVSKDIPPGGIAVGNPMCIVGSVYTRGG